MFRWLFHIFAGLSLLLMVASCAVWVRSSLGLSDHIRRDSLPSETVFGHTSGKFEVGFCVYDINVSKESEIDWSLYSEQDWGIGDDWDLTLATVEKHFAGIDYFAQEEKPAPGNVPFLWVQEFFLIRVPIVYPVVLFAMPPLVWLYFFKRRRRVHARLTKGLCLACGYDLQGNAGNCPECGAKRRCKLDG